MRSVFYVVKANDRWKIEGGSVNLEPCSTRSEAIQAAVAAAAVANPQPAYDAGAGADRKSIHLGNDTPG